MIMFSRTKALIFIPFPGEAKVKRDDEQLSLCHLKNKLQITTESESQDCVNIAARDPPEATNETPVFIPRRINPHIPQNSFPILPSYKGRSADP